MRLINDYLSKPMKSLPTYPIASQAPRWSHCGGMSVFIGKPGFGFDTEATVQAATNATIGQRSTNEDRTKEASR